MALLGITAAIYGKRSGLKVHIIEKGIIGGSISTTNIIENYPALMGISGFDFSMKLEKHLKDLEIDFTTENVLNIFKNDSLSTEMGVNIFEIETNKNKYLAKNIIISTGTVPKHLNIPGEKEYFGNGVSYCATCDGMLYRKKDVAVVGGGNTALESITILSEICNNVFVFVRGDEFRGEKIVVDKILQKENVHIMYNTTLSEIKGNNEFVTGIETTNGNYIVDGVFVTIGTNPNSETFRDLVSLNALNEIIVDHSTMETSIPRNLCNW